MEPVSTSTPLGTTTHDFLLEESLLATSRKKLQASMMGLHSPNVYKPDQLSQVLSEAETIALHFLKVKTETWLISECERGIGLALTQWRCITGAVQVRYGGAPSV